MSVSNRFWATLFRCALAVAPPAFRREYGAAMRDDFAHAFAEERTVHGTFGAAAYAVSATVDLFITALREYAAMLFRDFAYAFRTLRRTPSFSAVVIVTLALAIGANAAVFSILRSVVLAPLPYPEPDRLIALEAGQSGAPFAFSLPDFADAVTESSSEIASAAAFTRQSFTLTGTGDPRKLVAIDATPGLFATLGVRPQLGRFATATDVAPGAARTTVLSDELWRRTFAANPNVVGTLVRLDDEAYHVIGVAPPGLRQPSNGAGFQPADLWTFVPQDGAGTEYTRGYHDFNAVARLRPNATVTSAAAALARAAAHLRATHPNDDATLTLGDASLSDSLVGSARALLFALFGAVGAVLLVACANVANLLLSRAASRDREFSVRIAIGASSGRIVMQLLVETFVLAFAGGAFGIAIAYGAVAAFVAIRPENIPRADAVSVDAIALLYTFGVVGFCTLAAGLAPAIAASGRDAGVALKSAGRGGDAHRGARARNALVSCEIAITLALVIAAGLVVRSFVALTTQQLGFDPSGVDVVGPVELAGRRYAADANRAAFMDRAMQRVHALPGVESAAWGYGVPFTRMRIGTTFTMPDRPVPSGREPDTGAAIVGTGYLATLRATLVAGRSFTDADRTASAPVAIVNETFARTFYPGRSAIGRRIVPGFGLAAGKPPVRTIVGVVADMRKSFTKPNQPELFLPQRQVPIDESVIIVRGAAGAHAGAAVAAAIVALDPLVPKPPVTPMPALLATSVAVQRLTLAALCSLAFVAFVLSLAGVFAVVSYGVTQRTHEFGIRMALGADARAIVRMVIGGALRLAAIGIVAGLIVAGAGTRLIASQLYETQPLDPLTFGSVTILVIAAAVLAALVPARRATRVDPIVALRYE